jgi:hypothetical protein
MDVVTLIPQLLDKDNNTFPVVNEQEIRDIILTNDTQVRADLSGLYGTNLELGLSRVSTPTSSPANTSSGKLLLTDSTHSSSVFISKNDKAYSQVYKVLFTSATAFAISSELSGAQGNTTTSSDITTTDLVLTIEKECWNGTFVTDDVFYVKVHKYEGMLVHLSSLCAANYILNTIYTEEVPDASATAAKYDQMYRRLRRSLTTGEAFLEMGTISRNIDPIQIDYEVDEYGQDVTNYKDSEWNPRKVS